MEVQSEIEKTQALIDKLAEDWMEQSDKLSILTGVIEEKQNTKKAND